jgi:hypothetical protein
MLGYSRYTSVRPHAIDLGPPLARRWWRQDEPRDGLRQRLEQPEAPFFDDRGDLSDDGGAIDGSVKGVPIARGPEVQSQLQLNFEGLSSQREVPETVEVGLLVFRTFRASERS